MQKRVEKRTKYTSPAILREVVNAYLDECDALRTPYTLAGLCLATGLSREKLLRNRDEDEIGDVLDQARLLIEQQLEYRLGNGEKPTGIMLALKNLGWSEKASLDLGASSTSIGDGEVKYTIEVVKPDSSKTETQENGSEVSNTGKITPLFNQKKAV